MLNKVKNNNGSNVNKNVLEAKSSEYYKFNSTVNNTQSANSVIQTNNKIKC